MARRLGIPFAVAIDVFLIGLNITVGVSTLMRHHSHWKISFLNFGAAGFIAGMAVVSYRTHKRMQFIREEIRRLELEERMAWPEGALGLAKANFERVCKLLGAEAFNGYVDLRVKGILFRLTDSGVYKIDWAGQETNGTCYQIQQMPALEKIASAMLLLHNDPTVFDRWCRQDGYYV